MSDFKNESLNEGIELLKNIIDKTERLNDPFLAALLGFVVSIISTTLEGVSDQVKSGSFDSMNAFLVFVKCLRYAADKIESDVKRVKND